MTDDPRPYATLHSAERARQRLGRVVTRTEWMAAVLLITERAARLVMERPDGSEQWAVRIGLDIVEVIWKPEDAIIVTLATISRPWQRKPARDRRDWRRGDDA